MKQILRLQIPNVIARIRLNYLTSFVFLFFVHLSAWAQPATIWEKTLELGSPTAVIQTSDGGYAVLGDSKLVKLSKEGTTQWTRSFTINYLRSLEQTSDGGYILGGTSSALAGGDKSENPKGPYPSGTYIPSDYWVIKLSATGTRQWDRTLGGNLDDVFAAVHQTKDGGYIIGGHSSSKAGGDKTESPKGANQSEPEDYWLVKLSSTGTKLWDKIIGGAKSDYLTSMELTSDGGFVLGGLSNSNAGFDKSEPGSTYGDFWIVKVSANGTKEWDNTLVGGVDFITAKQTPDMGYIVGGSSYNNVFGDKTEASKGATDYWIVKLASNGSKVWDKGIGGSRGDELKSLELTSDGGYMLAGTSSSEVGGDKTASSGGIKAFWAVKTAATGLVQWDKTIEAVAQTSSYSKVDIRQTTDAGFILAGGTDVSTKVIRLGAFKPSPQPQITYLAPIADAFVRDGSFASTNFGSSAALEVKNGTPNSIKRESYLKFSVSGITEIGTAKLRVFGQNVETPNSVNLSAYGVANDTWTETGITWLNAPGAATALLASTAVSKIQYYDLDVTGYVKAQLAGDKTASFVLKNATGKNIKLAFNSKESATNPPQLVITTAAALNARVAQETDYIEEKVEVVKSRVYPNPVQKQFTLEIGNQHESDITLDLISTSRMIYNINPAIKPAKNAQTEVDLSDLSLHEGIHLLRIKSANSSETVKVMVVH
jgi:hypothetical protein